MCNLLECKDPMVGGTDYGYLLVNPLMFFSLHPHPIPFFPLSQTTQMILNGLANILQKAGTDVELIAMTIGMAGGLDKIEKLQNHKNVDIYKLAYYILGKYFPTEVSSLYLC